MSDSPSVASRPNESELDIELAELVNWQRFATHLPNLTRGDIEQIEQDNRDVQQQKLELFGTWLRRCPNASWNNIVLALEKSKQNTLADNIKMKFNEVISSDSSEAHDQAKPSSNQKVYLSSEKFVVEELKKLHRSFTSLARDIRCNLDELVKSRKCSLHCIAAFIQEARVCGIKGLTAVKTIDELFDAILPYNDYLDCELLEMIVEEYLDDDDITKVKAHIDKVKLFKCTAPIKMLKDQLQQYISIPNISDVHLIVTIKLQADWGRVTLESIEKLTQNLLQYRNIVRIFKVESGSISIMLLLPKEKFQHFIVTSSQKLQFMRLTGIFRLQIGAITVFKETEKKNFTFESAFLESSQFGDDEAVQFLLDLGVNVNYSNSEGQTALIIASKSGQEEVVQTLLSAGTNINHQGKYGYTALIVASQNGHLKVVKLLLKKGVDTNVRTNDGLTALIAANQNGHLFVVELLLKENADPNIQNKIGSTALIIVSDRGNFHLVEILLKEGADPNILNNDRATALMFASEKGHHYVVELLLNRNADPNVQSNEGWTALMIASQNGHLQIVNVLLEKKAGVNVHNNDGFTAIMFACQNGHLQVVTLLLKAKANPNLRSNDGTTALMIASQNGHLQVVEMLLKGSADPNVRNENGSTSLIFASHNGHFLVAERLLKERVDPNVYNKDGWTAVMFASRNSHHEVVQLLLKAKADPNVDSNMGWTALLAASMNGNFRIMEALLQHQANPDVVITMSLDSFQIASIKGYTKAVSTLLNHAEISLESILMGWYYACTNGHASIITLLSSRLDNVSNQTDLIISCAEGDLGSVVDQLMSGKTMPDAQFIHGVTPLMISSSCGHTDIAEAFIQSGADVNKTDDFGDTALDYAEQAKQDMTRVLLLQHDGLHGIELGLKYETPEKPLCKTAHDITAKKDISNLQSSHSSRQRNISSIMRYLEDSIETHFSKHQSGYAKDEITTTYM